MRLERTRPTLQARFTRPCRARIFVIPFAGALMLLGACQSTTSVADTDAPVFPEAKAQGDVLDVQVVRDGTTITLTNTTARAYGRSRIWLNRWFSRDIESFDVGQTLSFPLTDFRDRYNEAFRAGGFFATKRPERLVQAQLETADSLLGLVVVARGED